MNTSLLKNSSNASASEGCFTENTSQTGTYVKLAIYLVTMCVSLGGNFLVVCVVYRNRRLRTPTNFLITNMAVSDLIMTVTSMTPTSVAFITNDFSWPGGWIGNVTCKLINFVQCTSMASSIFTLTAIAFERFNAIVYPLRSTMRSLSTLWAIIAIWFCAGMIATPLLHVMKVIIDPSDSTTYCVEIWEPPFHMVDSPGIYTVVLFVLLYALPLAVIALLYACVVHTVWLRRIPGNINRSIRKLQRKVRKNVVKMLITVVVVFAIFWMPPHVLQIIRFYGNAFVECQVPEQLTLTTFILSHATGAINFLIYVAFSEDYKQGFQSLVFCLIGKGEMLMRPGQPSVRTEQTTENRRTSSKKKQDIELRKLTSNADLEDRSTPRNSKNVKFDMEYSSSV